MQASRTGRSDTIQDVAIEIEFANVIVRKTALERCYPTDIDAFILSLANFMEDDHLVRVGFMTTGEAVALVDELLRKGLSPTEVALVQDEAAPTWLDVDQIDHHRCCWLRGEPPGIVVRLTDDAFGLGLPLDARIDEIVRTRGATLDGARCTRGEAEIELQVLENEPSRMLIVMGRRERARRAQASSDRTLLSDVMSALNAAGARRLS